MSKCMFLRLVVLLTLLPSAALAEVTLVPYADTEYRYQVGGVAAGVESPAFDDSTWPVGTAAFGNNAACIPVNTDWPSATNIAVRKHLLMPTPAINARIYVAIDNDVMVFVNGVEVGSVGNDGCAYYDQYSYSIPDGLLHSGSNVIVAFAVDRGPCCNAFDMRVTADLLTPVGPRSWGQLKTLYR